MTHQPEVEEMRCATSEVVKDWNRARLGNVGRCRVCGRMVLVKVCCGGVVDLRHVNPGVLQRCKDIASFATSDEEPKRAEWTP